MNRPFALAVALTLCGAAPAPAAAVPSPIASTIPGTITVVGHDGSGHPDASGHFEVVIRDAGYNPIPDAFVYLDFTGCTDVRICQGQSIPGVTVVCRPDLQLLYGQADAAGRIAFDVMGAGTNTGASPGPGAGCMTVVVNGYFPVKNVTVSVLDQNGAVTTSGVEITDMTAWLRDLGSGTFFGRSDYSGNGSLDVVDLAILIRGLGTGASSSGCSTLVPAGTCY